MAFSEKPKKALFPLVLLFVLTAALLFFFRPCTFDLSQAHTLVIQSGTTGEKVEITNPQKIARIADQFVSLRFYRKQKLILMAGVTPFPGMMPRAMSKALSPFSALVKPFGKITITLFEGALWTPVYWKNGWK